MDGDIDDPVTLRFGIISNSHRQLNLVFMLLIRVTAVTQCNRMSTYARKTALYWKLINFSFCRETEQLKRANYKCEFSTLKSAQRSEWAFCGFGCTCDSQKKCRAQKAMKKFLSESFRTCCTLPQRHLKKRCPHEYVVQFSVVVNNGLVVSVHVASKSIPERKMGKALSKASQRGADTNWKAFLFHSGIPFHLEKAY